MLRRVKTIAVVGLSPNPARPSHGVSRSMQGFGYTIIPVHPAVKEILGERAYSRLADIPFAVDLVNVFRRAEHIEGVVNETVAIGSKNLWIQEGIVNISAAERARRAGIWVVMDLCIYRDYRQFCI